ncbi:hypothetical protein LJ707_07200 [Mucilaginibacter sp. UR6-1]|uniref:hypothetical protein n=1 Tax=Mucilaginibacter sp. UR6-1 TaxID=1435643 RepID=UPI001E368E07|nr:hypothetical protein [Mucilaginibacter sp. UR6-1]MCC8408709.1 hypothetical protein [Mucilaginibacter sp. UR6-1]
MIIKFTRLLMLTAIAAMATLTAKAQLGFNYSQHDLGIGISNNQVFGDAEKTTSTLSGSLSYTYNATPFVNYIVEFQAGTLKGGDSVEYRSGRQFKNNFIAGTLRAQVQAGEFIDYSSSALMDGLKNIYGSVGVGLVSNRIKEVSRNSNTIPGYYTPGKDESTEFYIPLKIGYEYKIFNSYNEPSVKIDLGYQVNVMTGENLDGFDAGSRRDIWTQLTLAVKFSIGSVTSYRKPLTRD